MCQAKTACLQYNIFIRDEQSKEGLSSFLSNEMKQNEKQLYLIDDRRN